MPGAWKKYKKISDKFTEEIETIAADEGFAEEEVIKKVDKIQTKKLLHLARPRLELKEPKLNKSIC